MRCRMPATRQAPSTYKMDPDEWYNADNNNDTDADDEDHANTNEEADAKNEDT